MKVKQADYSILSLYPLELSITHKAKAPPDVNKVNDGSSKTDPFITNQEVSRPKRKTTLKCNQFSKEYSISCSE